MGRKPSHFLMVDPIVKAYIISEMFCWAAWNFIFPLFAVFVVGQINKGTIALAATGFSTYLISRIIFELLSGTFFAKKAEKQKIVILLTGIATISLSYLGFSVSRDIVHIFFFYILFGAGIGIAAPVKCSLFSMHLDKNKEATEWSIADAASAMAMALASALAGFIVVIYGFRILFVMAAILNILSVIPYMLTLKRRKRD